MDENLTLRRLLEGTAMAIGEDFFKALVKNLALVLNVHGAWVTEYLPAEARLRALAFWLGDDWVEEYEYDVSGTPCEPVIENEFLFHVPENVIALFPDDPDLPGMGAVSYLGIPLKDVDRRIMGHLALLDNKPMPSHERLVTIFRIFAARAAAELQRLRTTQRLVAREAQLSRLFNGAMDAILELDSDGRITQCNPEAWRLLDLGDRPPQEIVFRDLITESCGKRLRDLIEDLEKNTDERPSRWVPGGFSCRDRQGNIMPVEATLSRYLSEGRPHYILILRDRRERLEAEEKIRTLTLQREYLRETVQELQDTGNILGESPLIRRAVWQIRQVAPTDATVLILGETGTGKELFAHAVHQQSRRADKQFVKVNCAALPAQLIESELFGHEKGAFTGATVQREGRFTLADGGTLFLDEIGELPLELQAKLLRVLQEGEFEPVGSSRTRKVDVRIVAATHRNLLLDAKQGKFREDLYYRLNVFPITVPPLRERGADISLLAQAFADRFARRFGRRLAPLSAQQRRELEQYPWPGNIRELQNVIERAVILATDEHLPLQLGLGVSPPSPPEDPALPATRIRTDAELRQLEKENIIRALDACNGKVSGEQGAAQLLGLPATTLSSRMKSLGIFPKYR